MITTIVMPVSRQDFLRRVFGQLELLNCDRENTNLLVYVDGDQELFQRVRQFVIGSKFKEKLCVYRRKGLPNVSHIKSRRKRIAEIHNEMNQIVSKCDYVFLIEDDTLLPLNALEKLLRLYTIYPFAGFVTGVQIGRWGYTVPGIWQVDNPYDIKRIETMLPVENLDSSTTVQEISAAGLYCCLTKPSNYSTFRFEPFGDLLGPDVSFGIHLKKQGYKNYVDWSINTSHLTKRGEIKVESTRLQKIIYTKEGENEWKEDVL